VLARGKRLCTNDEVTEFIKSEPKFWLTMAWGYAATCLDSTTNDCSYNDFDYMNMDAHKEDEYLKSIRMLKGNPFVGLKAYVVDKI